MYQRARKLLRAAFLPPRSSVSRRFLSSPALQASPTVQLVEELCPAPSASSSLASLANGHPVLGRLTQLGVELWRCERHAESLLRLDWEREAVPLLRLLATLGVDAGPVLTKNPLLLKEPVERIEARLAYLERKGFSGRSALARLVSAAPFLPMVSVERLDRRLALLQQLLAMDPPQLRALLLGAPRLATVSVYPVRETLFVIREEMGFSQDESGALLLACPRLLLLTSGRVLRERFALLHDQLGVSREALLDFPGVLRARAQVRVRPRALFLRRLGRDQWDPRKPGYVSLRALVAGSDAHFCDRVARSSLDTFYRFLKGL